MSKNNLSHPNSSQEHPFILDLQQEIASIQKEIGWIKKEVLNQSIEEKRELFGTYLQQAGIDTNRFPRAWWLGKFLRTFRYYKDIKTIALDRQIPLNYFFGLKMIEWEWDPSNINLTDWWAWISQIQPDTFKWFNAEHLKKPGKVFYDDPKYKEYDYAFLKKKHGSRRKANKIIADKLVEIRSEHKYDMSKLIALDDRFNPQVALEFSADYLLYCKKHVDINKLKDASRNVHKQDKEFDFVWMLALNGYNKWPSNYATEFEDPHISNLKTRTRQYDTYSQKLNQLLSAGYHFDQILDMLANDSQKTNTTAPSSSLKKPNAPVPTNTLQFLNLSKDKQWNVYQLSLDKQQPSYDFIQKLMLRFGGKEIQLTDATGKKYTRKDLTRLSNTTLYIKEKVKKKI